MQLVVQRYGVGHTGEVFSVGSMLQALKYGNIRLLNWCLPTRVHAAAILLAEDFGWLLI